MDYDPICEAVEISWIGNTQLNASLLTGMVLTSFSLLWTYW